MEKPDRGRVVTSWIWSLVPFVTLGFGTAPAMVWAAIRRRHVLQALVAALSSVLTLVYVIDVDRGQALITTFMIVNWLAGTGYALTIRRWAFELPQPVRLRQPNLPPNAALVERQRAALAAENDARAARAFARKLIAEDPARARRLRIGRVDIEHRAFPDGGLIDVNNVPATALAAASGLPYDVVERIVTCREEAGGFGSVEELCVLTQLAPQTFDHLLDLLYFPPRWAG